MFELSEEIKPTCWFVEDVESERDSGEAVFVLHLALILPGLLSGDGLTPVQGGLRCDLLRVAPPGHGGGRLTVAVTEDGSDEFSLPDSEAGGGQINLLWRI